MHTAAQAGYNIAARRITAYATSSHVRPRPRQPWLRLKTQTRQRPPPLNLRKTNTRGPEKRPPHRRQRHYGCAEGAMPPACQHDGEPALAASPSKEHGACVAGAQHVGWAGLPEPKLRGSCRPISLLLTMARNRPQQVGQQDQALRRRWTRQAPWFGPRFMERRFTGKRSIAKINRQSATFSRVSSGKARILVSNDDGYTARGIEALRRP